MTDFAARTFTAPDGIKTWYRFYDAGTDRLPVLCMHGLTRNSRDFADMIPSLTQAGRSVIAVDVRGRGHSDYDPRPENYNPGVYAQDMFGILAQEGWDRVITLGTSMGGLMSMVMAASRPGLIEAAIINDIGPELDPAGLTRIQGYVGGAGGPFEDWNAAAEAVRAINGTAFPRETGPDFWLAFARRTCRELETGGVVFDYDKAISELARTGNVAPPDLWPFFDALTASPILLIRGAITDLLAMSCVDEMRRRAPRMAYCEVPDVGHAPLLTEPEAASAIDAFLAGLD
ncbi:alpha/beta hydrolase [Alkalicaulis satelles]|uniref:Alpha/beta hydrolase n=1 Tax=Alkalicaulis satelles TaxID=2609175 RepID=A0A5M6ZIW5_9PROT|nr:alpha/beta hydrolase [Alkalicaulis satelles]KAA5804752.1 alpha/beta hydrolase [Alkalicaulis satelles]